MRQTPGGEGEATSNPGHGDSSVNGAAERGEKRSSSSSSSSGSPEAQSRGNNGNGGGHLRSSTTVHEMPPYDANGHNMATAPPPPPAPSVSSASVVGVEANQSSSRGPAETQRRELVDQQSAKQSNVDVGKIHRGDHHGNPPAPPHHSSVHDVNHQKLEFTFANFDPRDFNGGAGGVVGNDAADRLYLADDDHYSHEIKKNNALNQKFNNHHNYYGNHPSRQAHYAGYDDDAEAVKGGGGGGGGNVGVDDELVLGFVDGSAHSASGMIGRPGSGSSGSSVLIDKDLINDLKKPKPVAIGDSKFPPVNSKG